MLLLDFDAFIVTFVVVFLLLLVDRVLVVVNLVVVRTLVQLHLEEARQVSPADWDLCDRMGDGVSLIDGDGVGDTLSRI